MQRLSDLRTIDFKRNLDLKVFIHEQGDEFWLKRALYPVPMNTIKLQLNSNIGTCDADLIFKKSKFVTLSKKSNPCKDHDFNSCAKREISRKIRKENIDCSTAFWNELEEFGVPVCASLNKSSFFDLQSRLGKINRDFVRDPNSHGCPKLCTITKYNAKVEEFDEMTTSLVQGQDKQCESEYSLYIYFSMDHIEIIKEYLVYDMMTIISAIGGTMGLLLGYSILSMILSTLKLILQT